MYMMEMMEEPQKEEKKYKKDKSEKPRLADFIYFYTEDKKSCMVAYLQCDQSALDAGIMLISGMDWVDENYVNLDAISEWTEETFEDEPSHFIISKKVDYEMMTKITLQGMGPLSQINGYHNFLNLDEDINISYQRFFSKFDTLEDEPNRKILLDEMTPNVANILLNDLKFEPEQKSETQIIMEFRQKGEEAAKKSIAQEIDCNIYIMDEYNKALAFEKGYTDGANPPTK